MTCTKTVTLEIASSTGRAYWTLSEADPANDIDSVSGNLLTPSGPLAGVPAVIGNGLEIADGFGNMQQVGPEMQYAGNGCSVAFWLKATDIYAFMAYQWETTQPSDLYVEFQSNPTNCVAHLRLAGADVDTINLGPGVVDGNFHFYVVTYDPDDGKIRASIDGAVFTVSALSNAVPITPDPLARLGLFSTGGVSSIFWDEVALIPFPITQAQVSYLFNAGIGRTWPLNLP